MIDSRRFWNWARDENNDRALYLYGAIAEESWYDDTVTPTAFKSELYAGDGNITVYINSGGGDVIAASQIYTMLIEYPGDVTVKIDGIAASAASVVAMSGTKVLMSPCSQMMIHDPMTLAFGDCEEMRKTIDMLDQIKEGIITSYEIKTGLSRAKIASLMSAETWMNARKAIALGFADGILEDEKHRQGDDIAYSFSRKAFANCLLNKLRPQKPTGIPVESLPQRLFSLPH